MTPASYPRTALGCFAVGPFVLAACGVAGEFEPVEDAESTSATFMGSDSGTTTEAGVGTQGGQSTGTSNTTGTMTESGADTGASIESGSDTGAGPDLQNPEHELAIGAGYSFCDELIALDHEHQDIALGEVLTARAWQFPGYPEETWHFSADGGLRTTSTAHAHGEKRSGRWALDRGHLITHFVGRLDSSDTRVDQRIIRSITVVDGVPEGPDCRGVVLHRQRTNATNARVSYSGVRYGIGYTIQPSLVSVGVGSRLYTLTLTGNEYEMTTLGMDGGGAGQGHDCHGYGSGVDGIVEWVDSRATIEVPIASPGWGAEVETVEYALVRLDDETLLIEGLEARRNTAGEVEPCRPAQSAG